MNKISWSDSFSLDHEEIDNQHKSLLNLINKLSDNFENSDKEFIASLIDEILNYTHYHLNYEEKLLQVSNYSELETHKQSHQRKGTRFDPVFYKSPSSSSERIYWGRYRFGNKRRHQKLYIGSS